MGRQIYGNDEKPMDETPKEPFGGTAVAYSRFAQAQEILDSDQCSIGLDRRQTH